MNHLRQLTLLLITLTISIAANAEKVFEKVNKQGTAEFSDQKSAGSKEVNIVPNVVHSTLAPTEALPAAKSITSQPSGNRSAAGETSEIIGDGRRFRDKGRINSVDRAIREKEEHEVEHVKPKHDVRLRHK